MLCDDIVLLEDVIGRRLFKALLPRINVLFAKMAGLPDVKIESPEKFIIKSSDELSISDFYRSTKSGIVFNVMTRKKERNVR